MMAKFGYGLGMVVLVVAIATAFLASRTGWGLPGLLGEPVSVRQDSASRGPGSSRPHFIYFGSVRRHSGGGFRHGK